MKKNKMIEIGMKKAAEVGKKSKEEDIITMKKMNSLVQMMTMLKQKKTVIINMNLMN